MKEHFHAGTIEGLGLTDYDCGVIAAGALMQYLVETQKRDLSHISHLTIYASGKYMLLDSSTRRNLELCETLRDKQKRGSLLWVLDKTKTAMGARTLRKYIEQPLIDKSAIEKRLDAVDELVKMQFPERRSVNTFHRSMIWNGLCAGSHISLRIQEI